MIWKISLNSLEEISGVVLFKKFLTVSLKGTQYFVEHMLVNTSEKNLLKEQYTTAGGLAAEKFRNI